MSTKQEQVIAAVVKNKDIGSIIGEDGAIFGGFSAVADFMRDYYYQHHQTPSAALISERFTDVELPDVDAPTKYYVDELRKEYLSERLNSVLLGAARMLEKRSPEQVISKMQSSLAELDRFSGGVQDIDITDIDAALRYYEKVQESQAAGSGQAGVKTGIKAWDASLPNGIANGDNVLLFGYSGHGKSWIGSYLAVQAWLQNRKVLYLSLEMPPEQLRDRIYTLIGEGRFDLNDLRRAEVDEDDLRAFAKKFKDSPDFKIIGVDGAKPVTPNLVRSKMDQYGSTFVVCDYAQLMYNNGLSEEMTPRLMNLSREIRLMALGTNTPVVWISSVRDDESKKRDSAPIIGQLMGSRQLEYDTTLAVAVHQHQDGQVELANRKNRDGKLFNVVMDTDIPRGIWKESFEPGD